MPYIATKSTISSIATAKGCTVAAATAISTLITSFHCSRDDFWIIHCYTSFEKSWSIMAAVLRFLEGHRCLWLITSGYHRVFFRISDIKSLWLTDPLRQDGRSGGCMALWTVSSSSSLMSWVALTASPGHGMYMCFLNIADGHIQSWTQPAEGHLAWLEKASL